MSRPVGYTTLVQHRASIAPTGRSVGELLFELDDAGFRRIDPNTMVKVVLVFSVVGVLTMHLGAAASDILAFFAGVSALRLLVRKSVFARRRMVEVARALEDARDLRVVPALTEVYFSTRSWRKEPSGDPDLSCGKLSSLPRIAQRCAPRIVLCLTDAATASTLRWSVPEGVSRRRM